MKKTIRKLLAMALTFMLIVGMLPASVYAEGEEGYSLSMVVPGGGGTISCSLLGSDGSAVTRAKAGDTVTVRAEPDTDYKLVGLYLLKKDDPAPTTLYHQIASDFTQNTLNPKLYDFTMPDYDAKVAAVFQKTMTPVPVARTVTYQVKNGTWSDGGTQNKTETVNSGNFPANIPTGMIAATGYKVGAWDSNPSSTPITEDKTFTYTFIEEALAVTHTLTVTADPTEGGTVTGSDEYTAGTQVAAQAIAKDGYVFDGWYKGSERVGSFDWYIFNLNEDTNLVARFHKFTSAEVEVFIDAPLCGVETETTGSLPAGGYDGTTQTNRPTGTVKTAGWGEGSFGWERGFYGWNHAPSAFQGTFEGGGTYLVRGSIAPENRSMPDAVKIVVNSTELSSDRVQLINDTSYKAVQFIAQVKAVHNLVHHAKVDATCEQDGTEEYWQCEACGKYYSDAEGQTEITGPVTIPAGHDWGEWTVAKEATIEEEGQRVHSCMREGCGKTETEVIPRIRSFTISFDAGGGSGQMASVQVEGGEDWRLPQSTFTHPDKKAFKGWSAGGSEYQAGQKYTPTDDITFTALWSEAKYTGPSGIHYVEVGDSKTFTYKANEGWFYQVTGIEGLIPEALQFLSISGINGTSGIESNMSATEFTVTFAPTYFPEGSETMGEGYDAYTITHCETIIRPNIFWRNTGVGEYEYPLMDKFVVVPGRTSIELNETKLVLYPEDEFTLVATATPKSLDVTFTPGDNGVVSVDENGVVTALRPGKDTVTVSVGGDGNYLRSEAVVEIIVVERAELSLDPVESVEPDGNVEVSGRLLDMDGKGIGGQTIKIRAYPNNQGEDLTNEYRFPDVQTAEDGSFSAVGSWNVPDQFILEDFDVTVSLDSESFGCDPKSARVSVVNPVVNVTGSIVWDDGDNIDGRRPEKTWLMIRRTDGDPVLDKDGNPVADLVEIAGTKGTKRSATWENLPTHADIGGGRTQRVSYKVVEVDQDRMAWTPGGYEKLASGDMESGFVITNRYIPLQTDIVVKKVWEDEGDAAGKRPESVTLHVDQARPFSTSTDDDIKDVAAALTADKAGGWKAAWRGLPYRQIVSGFSTEILYSVREDAVKNYAGRLVQTNVGRRVSIVWADGISEEDKPASIAATLVYVNGDATSRTAVLNEANNWTCEFTGLPEHMAAAYNVSLFPSLQPELGYLQHAVVWGYTLTNTLIPAIELTIDVPQCGTVVDEGHSYPFNPATGEYDPAAQSNRPVGTILTSGWEFVKSDADPSANWLKWGPFTGWNNNPTMVFPITLTGGSSYNALGKIVPAGGAPVPAAFSLVVNGQELPADRFKVDQGIIYFAASIEAEHTLEKQARVEPTCTATGTEEHWKCTACGKLYSDENGQDEIAKPMAINALGHDWSEWIVTKDATETEEGIETRTCGHDASHTETRPIPKLDPANVSYHNTAGDGSEWTKGSKDKLGFAFKRSVDDDAAYDLFSDIKVDGKTVPQKDASGKANWTVKSGSVVIDLEPSFLETLSVGKHTLIAVFEDGSGAAEFTISQAPAPVTLTGIKLSDDSAKKIYTEGEALDVTGLTLEVEKSDGSKEAVDVTAAMVTGFDSGKIGKQILTVTYECFAATYEIEVKAKTDVPAVTYSCTKSDGTWTKGSTATLDFTFNRSFEDATTFAHFTGIKVDGKDVAETQYDAASGSVIIKLKPSFLETLSIGKHTLRAEFDDGSGAAEFTVEAKRQDQTDNGPISPTPSNANTTPKTGDGSNAPLWIWLMAISMGALLFAGNRRRHTE